MTLVTETNIPTKLLKKGKVRDMYDLEDSLLMIATDRISAFDVVFPNGIPYKGQCLTQISLFWFNMMKDIIENHVKTAELTQYPKELQLEQLKGRSIIIKKTDVLPVECIVRGYLAGSGWRSYQKTGEVCGIALPEGMQESEKFDTPLFTPSTKAEEGHDENISFEKMSELIGSELANQVKQKSIEIYKRGNEHANSKGMILADTKFEFGLLDNKLILIDELLTPDSSRFWPMNEWKPGSTPNSLDKEYLRQYLLKSDWNQKPPAPTLPQEVVQETSRRYLEIYKTLTGRELNV
ncbi:phosphoribosylaminoimidazolesuccinocarboxamide synthase [archaeon]|nr:phosphoribosylaminoimidazolesuccinocarboxamide synthase [archaeon]